MNFRSHLLYFTWLSFFNLAAWSCFIHAQDEKKFQLYTIADGLSDNNITAIAQDRNGYMWLGTFQGLNRYDGRRFVQFHEGNAGNGLPDENITHLLWLDKSRLAVYTGIGMQIINTVHWKTDDIIISTKDPKYLHKFNGLMSALSDQQGNIYLLTRSGFYHYDPYYKLVFRFDYYNTEEIETAWFQFGKGAYWFSTNEILVDAIDGKYIYNTQTRQLNKVKSNYPLLSEIITHHGLIQQIEPGHLIFFMDGSDSIIYINNNLKRKIISTASIQNLGNEFNWHSNLFKVTDSLFYITGKQNGFFKMRIDKVAGKVVIEPRKYLADYLCNDFIIDKDNRLWIATNAGLLKETYNITSVKQIAIPPDILKQTPDIRIRQIFCYRDKLYAACVGRGGLLVFDKNTLSFLYRISLKKYFRSPDDIFSISQARDDTLFLGTNGPLFWLKASTAKTGEMKLQGWDREHNWIAEQFKDKQGNIWVTTDDNSKVYMLAADAHKFSRLNYDIGSFRKLVTAFKINQDAAGNIWMAGHGICRINQASGKPEFYLDSFPWIRFQRREVSAMMFDQKNTLWLGIKNNGLAAYNIDKGTFNHYTTSEGLPDNFIQAVYPINNKLWIATATGMASLDMRTNKISKFSVDDGFAPLSISGTSLFYDSSTRYLYSGFTNHIVRFYPDSLLYSGTPPNFFIESIHFSNDTTYCFPGETITVPHYKNDLMVRVCSINYNDVNNQRIAYRIVNSNDTLWRSLSGDLINFNNLTPGTYRLQVKLYAANNRWPTQTREMDIIVMPPFWRTSWFIAYMSIVLLSVIYLIYKTRINTIKKTERAKVQLEQLKTEEFKNRLELENISNYFSSSLSAKKSINDVLWDVAGNLTRWMGYVDCMIYLWNEEKTKMVQKAGYGPKGSPEAIARHVFDVVPGQGVVGYVIDTKEPVLIADTRKDKRYRPDEIFRLSEICVPIIHNGELIGIIDSEHHAPNYFKERELKILTTIATLVGNKIKQVESEQSLAAKRHELATINEQLAEAQLTALQAQMNPHFIFNALNSIKRMILDNENDNASRYLSTFAQMIRLTLSHSKVTFITLQETIEYLHAYLDMEQLRFDSSFSYKIETLGEIEEDINIPTLMIQPLAENAIWHGLMHKAGSKRIIIRFVQKGNTVTCTIEDNGIGIHQSEKMKFTNPWPHVGLDNLRNRIKIMNEKYGLNCVLEITDLSEKNIHQTGTLVLLQFKIIPQKIKV
ncbi:MAG TPA: histidine kinase [Chitinophagaceae bacterium]|jgi:ligand-binding sensor domain-containing protein|nr:histidine kinase [Chitinophagaceae bacterium]